MKNLAEYPRERLWYAVWTRSRQEKKAAEVLDTLGIEHFLPLKSELRAWSDRRQRVTVPLFSGYLFVRVNLGSDSRLRVLKTPAIVGFVSNQRGPVPIPEQQLDAVRAALASGSECTTYPYDGSMVAEWKQGDRVRVRRGILAGIEGTLMRTSSAYRLLLSVESIRRSIAVNICETDIEFTEPNPAWRLAGLPKETIGTGRILSEE